MRRVFAVLAAIAGLAAQPAAAQTAASRAAADLAAQQRRLDSQQALSQLPQAQRLDELDRRLTDLDLQRRTEQNLRSLEAAQAATANAEPYPVTPLAAVPPAQTSAYDRQRDAELEASNARLRAIMAGR